MCGYSAGSRQGFWPRRPLWKWVSFNERSHDDLILKQSQRASNIMGKTLAHARVTCKKQPTSIAIHKTVVRSAPNATSGLPPQHP